MYLCFPERMPGLSTIVSNDITARGLQKGLRALVYRVHVTIEIGQFSSRFLRWFPICRMDLE